METEHPKKGFSGLQVLGIILLVFTLTLAGSVLFARTYLFPQPFKPVVLSEKEQTVLSSKLQSLADIKAANSKTVKGSGYDLAEPPKMHDNGALVPQPYTENPAHRTVTFTERELNGMLAKNTDLADKVAIDLDNDMLSVNMLIPLDPDFPILGGKVLRINAGTELAYRQNRPVVILRGVSLMGVPLPKAWLGGLKNVDLIEEFGTEDGFWQAFAEGIASLQVSEGTLEVILNE
ncbi:hypothetical protein [Desulfogranum japonicum]|uniref:hypothetical protein n=1 Tax=Desulfogranum japonicum TaxID=231447 RepID=UPI00042321F5|nr:hypothetical protein [Desulfogranum japonicum]